MHALLMLKLTSTEKNDISQIMRHSPSMNQSQQPRNGPPMPPSFASRTQLNSTHNVPSGLPPPPISGPGGGGGPPLLSQHGQSSAFKYLSDSVQHSNGGRMDNDFPSLAAVNSGRGRLGEQLRGYAGQFSKPPDQQSEFIITKDDFPALGKSSNTSILTGLVLTWRKS